MQKVPLHFYKSQKSFLHGVLKSFQTEKVLFHLSLTGTIYYRLLEILKIRE